MGKLFVLLSSTLKGLHLLSSGLTFDAKTRFDIIAMVGDATFDKELAETLIDLKVPSEIKFSPNGKRVVYSAGRREKVRQGKHFVSSLWLASARVPASARQLTLGSYNDASPRWHPDGNRIFFLSDRSQAGKKYGVWALRLDGGEATAITPTDGEQGISCWQMSPDGGTVAYLTADEKSEEERKNAKDGESEPDVWDEKWEYARLRLVDVETKETRDLVRVDRHITELNWSPDGKDIVFRSKKNTESEEALITGNTISIVQVESGVVRDLCTAKALLGGLEWAPDGKIYFVCVAPMGKALGGVTISAIDTAEDTPSATIVRVAYGEEDDAVNVRVVGGRIVAKRDKRLSSIIGEVGGLDYFSRQPSVFGDWDVFFDPVSGDISLATSLSSVNEPEEVFILSRNGNDMVQLSDHGKAFIDRRTTAKRVFGSHRVLKCPSADGEVEIDGLYLMPTSTMPDEHEEPREPFPTIVLIHGGPNMKNSAAFDASGQYWATYALIQGYGVLLPQYRGSSGRGEPFAQYSRLGVGTYDYSDVISLTNAAVTSGLADAKRLMVGGWSQGGYLTYLCSVRNGQHSFGWTFRAGIAGAGVTDWDSLCMTSRAGAVFQPELSGERAPWLISDKRDTTARNGSAIWEMAHAVEESKRRGREIAIPPVLILHGTEDKQCSTTQAVGFHRGARAHGLQCEFVRYPGEGHTITARRFRIDMLERFANWCHRYIGPGGATMAEKVTEE